MIRRILPLEALFLLLIMGAAPKAGAQELNQRIEHLLKDSLDIINFSVSLFSGAGPGGRTYSGAGEERPPDEKPASLVLDIKA